MESAIEIEQHRLTRRYVTDALKVEHVQRHALGRHHVLHPIVGFAAAEHQRSDAVRIAEGH
jgi:hypothetical protein